MKVLHKTTIGIAAILVLLGAISLWGIWKYYSRPYFRNTFGVHPDKGGLPYWRAEPAPLHDDYGNYADVDIPNNVCVIAKGGRENGSGQVLPVIYGNEVEFDVQWHKVRFPMPRDELLVLGPTGILFRRRLPPGGALPLYRKLLTETPSGKRSIQVPEGETW